MKVKSTKNGNVKIVMSPEEAKDLKTILNWSHKIDYPYGEPKEQIEKTSWNIHRALTDVNVEAHG